MGFPTDLEIAKAATLRPLTDIAAEMGIGQHLVTPYGRQTAKIELAAIDELADHAAGARGWGTVGGERELAVLGQHNVLSGEECGGWLTRGAGWAWPWPESRRQPWRACCSSTSWSRCGMPKRGRVVWEIGWRSGGGS